MLCYINSLFFHKFWLPWNLNVVLAAYPIYIIGHIYQKYKFNFNSVVLLFVPALIIAIGYKRPEMKFDMKMSLYGIPFLSFFLSLTIILFIRNLSILFSNYKFITITFSELGKSSMVIMYLHQPIQLIADTFFKYNCFIRFVLAIVIPYLIYFFILNRFSFTKAIFLGNKFEMYNISKKIKNICSIN